MTDAYFDKYIPLYKTASASIGIEEVKSHGHFIPTQSGIALDMPDPIIAMQDYTSKFTNASAGYVNIINEDETIALAPGSSVEFRCERIENASPWACSWIAIGLENPPKWVDGVDDLTPTYTTATPVHSSEVYRYLVEEGVLHVEIDYAGLDGGGATALTVPLPFIPQDLDVMVPLTANVTIGTGTPTNILAYVDVTNATAETRATIAFRNFQTLTDDSAWRIRITGAIPLWGCNTFTSTPAWTGSPTVTSTTGIYKVVNGTCYGWIYSIESDGKGASTATFTLPTQINDVDQLIACEAIELVDATYSNPVCYIEAANATCANRLISFASLSTLTDGKGCSIAVSFKYNLHNDLVHTVTEAWDTAPASYTSVFRYAVIGRKCIWAYYGTSADGNGASTLSIPIPVVPSYIATLRVAAASIQLVDTTYSCPACYIDAGQSTAAGRALLRFENLSACTDAKTATLMASGEFEIAAAA